MFKLLKKLVSYLDDSSKFLSNQGIYPHGFEGYGIPYITDDQLNTKIINTSDDRQKAIRTKNTSSQRHRKI